MLKCFRGICRVCVCHLAQLMETEVNKDLFIAFLFGTIFALQISPQKKETGKKDEYAEKPIVLNT